MNSIGLEKLRDAAEKAEKTETKGRALGRYVKALACGIASMKTLESENAALRARVAELEKKPAHKFCPCENDPAWQIPAHMVAICSDPEYGADGLCNNCDHSRECHAGAKP